MKLLKLIGVLLDYPDDELWLHREELIAAAADPCLSPQRTAQLTGFVTALMDADPITMQERWVSLFDRGRAMSLLLFEHIHGESRDRGQAMADLMQAYQDNGFVLAVRELPDYLPLVLEYLSLRPLDEARDWLGHTRHIIELLAARAAERESAYALLFELLAEFSGERSNLQTIRRSVAGEARDDTPQALDRVWEEETVRFGARAPDVDCAPPDRLPAGVERVAHKESRA
ncbi:nitrate reductase delta subunit [Steroidobacter denitrificans]|uniref:Nitrate reductase delta subunit n=1 Tax=Steroidobacter denitrificans TaxID=465721 RepID=A0A127FDB3_STEDE|nr:nitrate reductase molybdenum cofactor assembly chaperone [Steroidobacter denitrificans]AMN47599.1 nitrate reductase delta subunit [Steroidobacter denitrificans]